ncbi:plant self-incompatibility S1 [Artemisia annua]|uniref:S-protein homolog n=1 Tax=Artemisia annua TaxID=35608 RepID=A0A2U1PFE2_ARTAN|nr:plant self-incompatibility S1 [Artemisia annua]
MKTGVSVKTYGKLPFSMLLSTGMVQGPLLLVCMIILLSHIAKKHGVFGKHENVSDDSTIEQQYLRANENGVPFIITVVSTSSVTIRERDTQDQIIVSVEKVAAVVKELSKTPTANALKICPWDFWAIYIYNAMNDPIHVNVKSEDDDLGDHTLALNENENWSFCENIWKTTFFYASFNWNGSRTASFGLSAGEEVESEYEVDGCFYVSTR